MPPGALTPIVRWQVSAAAGAPVPGAQLHTWLSGTSTPQPVYTDAALTVPHPHPVVADIHGTFPAIYLAAVAHRVRVTTSTGVTVFPDQDDVYDFAQVQAGAAAGADTQVQFNDGGVLRGAVGLTYSKPDLSVRVAGHLQIGADRYIHTPSTSGFTGLWGAQPNLPAQGGGINVYGIASTGAGSVVVALGANAAADFVVKRVDGAPALTVAGATGDATLAGALRVTGYVFLGAAGAATPIVVGLNTADGADTAALHLCGGGASGSGRGAYTVLHGNENTGRYLCYVGTVAGASFEVLRQDGLAALFIAGATGAATFLSTVQAAYPTTAAAANAVVTDGGALSRSTSSVRGKTGIVPLTDWRWFLDLTPVEFADIHHPEGRKYLGFTAEDVVAHGPMRHGLPLCAGLTPDGAPDDVTYAHLTAVIQLALTDLDRRLAAVEA